MENIGKDKPDMETGGNYLSASDQAEFEKMIGPRIFDVNTVTNKYLDIQYGTLPEQKLDLYLPDHAEGPYPVLFDVHGGGWCLGTKREGFLEYLIDAIYSGYAVISPDYRLAPGVKFPENLFDIKTAVRWARAHAEVYGLDPEKFGMIGDSAGGHLTLMTGFTAGHPEYAGLQYGWADYSDEVQAICDMFGPSILDDFSDTFFQESGIPRAVFGDGSMDMIKMAFGTDRNLLKVVSPISYVSKSIPPTLIMQGKMDGVVAYQHSEYLYKRIVEVCGEGKAELLMYEDYNHEDYGFYADGALCKTVIPFFDKYLK